MVLIIWNAEELKRDVISSFEAQTRWRASQGDAESSVAVAALGAGKKLTRAFAFLEKDGVLSASERRTMIELIDRRNAIAHHIEEVVADLSTDREAREWLEFIPGRKTFGHETLQQLRDARSLLSERVAAKHYVMEISFRGVFFETTERALNADIKAGETNSPARPSTKQRH